MLLLLVVGKDCSVSKSSSPASSSISMSCYICYFFKLINHLYFIIIIHVDHRSNCRFLEPL